METVSLIKREKSSNSSFGLHQHKGLSMLSHLFIMKRYTCKNTNVSNRSALLKADFQFQPDSTQTARKPFPDSILVVHESERVNGDVSPSQHTLITFFKSPHPYPRGTHTKGTLEDNENSGPAVRAHMGWCWEPRLIIHVKF